MRERRSGPTWRLACAGLAVLLCWTSTTVVNAQESDADGCEEVTAVGLLAVDDFPADLMEYVNIQDDPDARGKYVSDSDTHFIWYSPTDPTEYTSDRLEASLSECSGYWVISTYPVGDRFSDMVWYQSEGANCEITPAQLSGDSWRRATRECDTCAPDFTDEEVAVTCVVEIEEDEKNGMSAKTLIILIIIVGVGFMVFMCLGALACCIRGKNSPEEAVMPPGELGDGSSIGGKATQNLKPGLHAHPEVEGAQHPRPEGWAPSYASNSSIPQGSRSGPSVRSIGYS